MAKEPIIIFVEDYKNMSKEEFALYIKKIWNEGYEAGKAENFYPLNTWTDNIHIKGNVTGTPLSDNIRLDSSDNICYDATVPKR